MTSLPQETRQLQPTKQWAISMTILKRIDHGMTASEAMDATFGPGTFDDLAGNLYDELREVQEASL